MKRIAWSVLFGWGIFTLFVWGAPPVDSSATGELLPDSTRIDSLPPMTEIRVPGITPAPFIQSIAREKFTSDDVSSLPFTPTSFGQALNFLPGLIGNGPMETSVRGRLQSPDQNVLELDGFELPATFSAGLLSAQNGLLGFLPSSLVSRLTLDNSRERSDCYPSLGSRISVNLRNREITRFSGRGAITLNDYALSMETPWDQNRGRLSLSYFENVPRPLEYLLVDKLEFKPENRFRNLLMKMDYDLSPATQVSFLGLGYRQQRRFFTIQPDSITTDPLGISDAEATEEARLAGLKITTETPYGFLNFRATYSREDLLNHLPGYHYLLIAGDKLNLTASSNSQMSENRSLVFGVRLTGLSEKQSWAAAEPTKQVISANDTATSIQGQVFSEIHQTVTKQLDVEASGAFGYFSLTNQNFGDFVVSLNQNWSAAQLRFSAGLKAIPTNPMIVAMSQEGENRIKPVLAVPLQLTLSIPAVLKGLSSRMDSSALKITVYDIEYTHGLQKIIIQDGTGRFLWELNNDGTGFSRGVETSLRLYHRSGFSALVGAAAAKTYSFNAAAENYSGRSRLATSLSLLTSYAPPASSLRWGLRSRLLTQAPDDMFRWALRRPPEADGLDEMVLGSFDLTQDHRVYTMIGAFGEWHKVFSRNVVKLFGSLDYSPSEPYQTKRQWLQNPHQFNWMGEISSLPYGSPVSYYYYLYPYCGLEIQF